MHKQVIRGFLSLFASALMAHAAVADDATFTLSTPRYYKDGYMVSGEPDFVSGTRGTFTVFESSSVATYSDYVGNGKIPEGYYISKWQLCTTGGGTVIQTWEDVNSIRITFQYKWAKNYGTWLELYAWLSPFSYTLAYDANGGDWTYGSGPDGGSCTYPATKTAPGSSCATRRAGDSEYYYEPVGWNTHKDGSGVDIAFGQTFSGKDVGATKDGKVTLYYIWKAPEFSVTLNANGGTVSGLTKYTYGVGATLPTPKQDGYKFLGWYDSSDFSGTRVTAISKTDTGDKEYWAKWEQSNFTVTLAVPTGGTLKNGSAFSLESSDDEWDYYAGTYTSGKAMTLPTVVWSDGSYTFKGWCDNSLLEGSTVTKITTSATGDLEFWAKSAQAKCYVTLVLPNGATVAKLPSDATTTEEDDETYVTYAYTVGKATTLPKATKDDGSKFYGWWDNPTFTGDAVTKITKYDEGDLTFYAKFPMSIRFDGNGASGGTMANQEFSAGVPLSLTRNKFEKKYVIKFNANGGTGSYTNAVAEYTFSHWNTKKDGTGESYGDGAYVTFAESQAVTLYAQWEPDEVSVPLPSEKPTKKDTSYDFSGWYTAQTGGYRVGGAGGSFVPDGSQTLYAQWGGSGSLSAAVGLTNAELTTSCKGGANEWKVYTDTKDNLFARTAPTCLGCTPNKTKGEITILSINITGPGKVSFWACKSSSSKDYSFSLFDGKVNQPIVDLPDDSQYKFYSYRVNVSGSVEVRWSVESIGEGEPTIYLDDITWESDSTKDSYTVTVTADPNAGGTVTGGGTYKAGDTAALSAKPKSNYKFIRWSDGSTDNPRDVTVTADAAYTAIFSSDYYYIAYNANGGTGTMDKQLAMRDEATTLKANAYTRSGYTFAGWAKTKTGAVDYADKTSVMNLASKGSTATLYAVWTSGSDPEPTPEPEPEPTPEEPEPGPYASAVGEAVSVDLAADCAGYTIKSVSGLPTGLKYSKTTGLVTGTPTRAVSKENNVTITFTDKTKVKATWTVEALPSMMVGTYYGAATVGGIAGQFQLKLAATGKATGYFYAAGKRIALKSTALTAVDDDCYSVTAAYTYNRVKYTDEILLMNAATVGDVDVWSATLGATSEALDDLDARRDTIKECFGKVVTKTTTYDVIEKTDEGEYLTARVTTAGAVTVSGKLLSDAGKLTSVSCSTHLVVSDDGVPYCYITIYKAVSKSEPIVYEAVWELPEE